MKQNLFLLIEMLKLFYCHLWLLITNQENYKVIWIICEIIQNCILHSLFFISSWESLVSTIYYINPPRFTLKKGGKGT